MSHQDREDIEDKLEARIVELETREAKLRESGQRVAREAKAGADYIAKLKRGIAAVEHLIDQTSGVTGLHLNGDDAPWDDLREGGEYEAWLIDFDAALATAQEQGERRDVHDLPLGLTPEEEPDDDES